MFRLLNHHATAILSATERTGSWEVKPVLIGQLVHKNFKLYLNLIQEFKRTAIIMTSWTTPKLMHTDKFIFQFRRHRYLVKSKAGTTAFTKKAIYPSTASLIVLASFKSTAKITIIKIIPRDTTINSHFVRRSFSCSGSRGDVNNPTYSSSCFCLRSYRREASDLKQLRSQKLIKDYLVMNAKYGMLVMRVITNAASANPTTSSEDSWYITLRIESLVRTRRPKVSTKTEEIIMKMERRAISPNILTLKMVLLPRSDIS